MCETCRVEHFPFALQHRASSQLHEFEGGERWRQWIRNS